MRAVVQKVTDAHITINGLSEKEIGTGLVIFLGIEAADLLGNTELLTNILLYHVAHGKRDAEDITSSDRVRTLAKEFLMQDSGVLTDNNGRDATIIAIDIPASNGIVHVIDTVVLP